MAVDTRTRRFSMMALGRVASSPVLDPDGGIVSADRTTLLGTYVLPRAAPAVIDHRTVTARTVDSRTVDALTTDSRTV